MSRPVRAFFARGGVAFVIAAAFALTTLSSAWASSGGQDPSSAPGMGVGAHPFSACPDDSNYELWALSGITNGDRIILNLNNDANAIYSHGLELIPPSADDFSWTSQTKPQVRSWWVQGCDAPSTSSDFCQLDNSSLSS